MDSTSSGHLARLDEDDDLKVADGYEDVRGWSVQSSDGQLVGEVKHLIADPTAMRVRYLEIELSDALRARDASNDRCVLLPIGAVRLDDRDDHVIVDTLAAAQFAMLPTYARDTAITRGYETALRDQFASGGAAAVAGSAAAAGLADTRPADDFYADASYDDARFRSGRGMRGAGGTRGIDDGSRMTRPIDDTRTDL